MNKHTQNAQQDAARIRWRCHRGMLELDLFLLPFVDQEYANLSEDEKATLLRMLETPDPELFAWLMGHEQPDQKEFAELVAHIRRHRSQSL